MADVTLSATTRTEFGKGPSRRLRRDHQIPAVLYGHGVAPVHLVLPGHETAMALKNPNVLLSLQVEGQGEQLALPKAIQRDPLRGTVEHVDLISVRRGEKVVVDIPVHTLGDPDSAAVLTLENSTLSVRADAAELPSDVTVDVDGLEAGTTITAAAISLPEGVELVTDPETAIVVVSAPQVEAPAEDAEEAALGEVPTIGESEAGDDAGEQG